MYKVYIEYDIPPPTHFGNHIFPLFGNEFTLYLSPGPFCQIPRGRGGWAEI